MSKVEVKNVNMNYHTIKDETPALRNINIKIDEGEFISLVGPSGCGKSTLLNIIAGLIRPSSGEILVDGKVYSRYCSDLGYMFQKDHLFEWLNIWENVILGLKIQSRVTDKKKKNVEKLLKNYGLWEFRDHRPSELSGGMRQRVALIRTLALDPKVLLLDEPFSALDYQTRLKVSDEIYEIIKKENKTAIMVTHDISEAVSMSSRVIILSRRPAVIKDDMKIEYDKIYDTPLKRREAPNFKDYFNKIWKEMDIRSDD